MTRTMGWTLRGKIHTERDAFEFGLRRDGGGVSSKLFDGNRRNKPHLVALKAGVNENRKFKPVGCEMNGRKSSPEKGFGNLSGSGSISYARITITQSRF